MASKLEGMDREQLLQQCQKQTMLLRKTKVKLDGKAEGSDVPRVVSNSRSTPCPAPGHLSNRRPPLLRAQGRERPAQGQSPVCSCGGDWGLGGGGGQVQALGAAAQEEQQRQGCTGWSLLAAVRRQRLAMVLQQLACML